MRSALRGLRGHLGRLVATTLAVVFGVAFVAGTLIFADTTRAAYTNAFSAVAKNVDVSVRPAGEDLLTADDIAYVRQQPAAAATSAWMAARLALLDAHDRPVTNFGLVGWAVSTDGPVDLLPFALTGRVPGADEALLDTDTAQRLGYEIGDTITVVDATGERHGRSLVGILDFGADGRYAGETVVGLPAAAITALTGVDGYEEIVARARPGVTSADLADAVDLGTRAVVVTGEARRTELLDAEASWLVPLRLFLLLFGVVSLIVAAFVIYNTFAVLTALRVRQLALLRCVGATRAQLFGATLAQSAIVGVVGGGAGVLGGVGVAYALVALLNSQLDMRIPAAAPVVGAAAIAVGLVLGVGVTVAAAVLPALRATRTSPLAALGDHAVEAGTRRRVVRSVLAALVGLAGIALTVVGSREPDLETGTVLVVAGGTVTFFGLLVAAPLFVGPLSTVLGALPARLFGSPARLASANTRRNPGRTAITSATLMIGIGLMSIFCVVFSSLQVTATQQISEQYPVDFVVTGLRYGPDEPVLPAGYADAVRSRPEFAGVAQVRSVNATVGDEQVRAGAVDPASLGSLVTPPVTAGALADLGPGTAIVATNRFGIGETPLGATLTVAGPVSTIPVRVVALAPALVPGAGNLDLLVSWSDLAAIGGDVPETAVLAKAAPGVSPVAATAALDALAQEYPLASVGSVADLSSDLESTVNSILAVIAGLLVITVLISLFGIANTLALSVVERTRESATVRALGLTRGQLRGSLFTESVLMAAVGAVVGLGFGLVYGAILVNKAMSLLQPVVVVPWSWFLGIVAIAAVTAVLAAVLPARRAARSSIVEAMAQT